MAYKYTGPDLFCEYCDEMIDAEEVTREMTQVMNTDTEDMVSVHKKCKANMLNIYENNREGTK